MPPSTVYKRLETREQLWAELSVDSSLQTKTKIEEVLRRRGEFPVIILGIEDLEEADIQKINEGSPIEEDMLMVESS